MYGLDFNKLIQWLLPAAIRKPNMIGWLNALLAPARTLHSTFLLFSNNVRLDLEITGQVRVLEFHLNRLWSPEFNHIYITDSVSADQVYMYLESENQPLYLPIFISGQATDFTVHLPNDLPPKEVQIRAFLNKYKLPTKRYELVYDIIVI